MTKAPEPAWLIRARQSLGLRETPGPTNNPTIIGWAKALGAKVAIVVEDASHAEVTRVNFRDVIEVSRSDRHIDRPTNFHIIRTSPVSVGHAGDRETSGELSL